MTLDSEGSLHFLGYWLGGFLSNTGLGENFPELADLGPVSHTMSKVYPLHQYMHDTFMEGVGRGEVKKGTLKAVTTKKIYKSRIDDMLTSPKVESKFPQVNFQTLVYPRVNHAVLEVRQKDVMFSIIHGLYRNRDRLFQQHRLDDPLCCNQA